MEHLDHDTLWAYIVYDEEVEHIEAIQHHLDICERCKDEYTFLVKFNKELYTVEDDIPSPNFSSIIITKIEKNIKVEKAYQFWLNFAKMTLIGAMIIVIILPMSFLIIRRAEFTINYEYTNKIIFPLISSCIVVCVFYILDIFFRRIYSK